MEDVGRPVRVFWENEGEWYQGQIENYVPDTGYHIQYHDGDEEWLETLEGVEFEDEELGNTAHNKDDYEDTNDTYGATEESFQDEEQQQPQGGGLELGTAHQHMSVYDQDGGGGDGGVGDSSAGGAGNYHGRESDVEDDVPTGTTLRTMSVSPVSSPKRSARRDRDRDREEREEEEEEEERDRRRNRSEAPVHPASTMEDDEEGQELDFQSSLHSTKELNTNGVLLKGEVLGANNLPEGEAGGAGAGVFYRVLYAEGGDESSVFRCKTPIYKSEVTFDLEFPRWGADKKFRFEMVLPGDESLEESDFTDHGDIIVAVYKSRSNGGSDFVGQVCIQLQDFIRVGTVGRARPHSHCRLLRGCFPLISRHGDIVGDGLADVDIDISLEWRLVDKPPSSSSLKTRSAIEEITARNKKQASASKGNTGSKRPKSGKSKTAPGKNSSAAMSSLRASRRSRQQTLLDAQNDKIRNRLERAGPKQPKRTTGSSSQAGHKASDNTTVSEIYRPAAAAMTADRKKASSSRRDVGSKGGEGGDKKRSGAMAGSRAMNLSGLGHEDLVGEYESMKKKIGEAQGELHSLRTMDSKLKAQVTKNEAVTGRLKKIELNNRKKSNLESFSKAQAEEKEEKGLEGQEESFYSVQNLLLRAGIEEDEDQLSDDLLRERLAEHSILQQTRMGCLQRIEAAKTSQVQDEASLKKCMQEIEHKYRELEARASRLDKPKNDWNLHILNKESKTTSLKAEVSELNMMHKLNLDPELSKCLDEIANSSARIDYLEAALRQKTDELDGLRFDADSWKERLSDLQQVDVEGGQGGELSLASHLRQSITMIQNSIYRLKSQERMMKLKSDTDAVELEVLRHDLNHKQSIC